MSLISDAKNLYVVDDRTTIKNYINRDVDYWVKMDTVPTLEQVIEDLFDNDEFICQPYEESKRLADKDWLEMLSVYSMAKNIQNLVSFNMPDDFDESFSKKKLSIKESIESNLIDELNSLDIYKGDRATTYEAIKEYESVLNKFPEGTVIGEDWDAGPCYFRKSDKGWWDQLISPHYDLKTLPAFDTARWLAGRGNWCKKPLWIDDVSTFESIAYREKGSGGSGMNFWGPSDKKNYGQKKGFYGI